MEIVPFKKSWQADFQEIATTLRQGLGNLALRIDHIGSTSVEGLAAKDVIDIQITVAGFDECLIDAMTKIGYTPNMRVKCDHIPPNYIGSKSEWRKLMFNEPPDQRRTNIHVRIEGLYNQRYPLLFRDYLRSHQATADAYAELKRRLAKNLADPSTYPDIKDPAVDLIYLAAEEWAVAKKWQPGPSDA